MNSPGPTPNADTTRRSIFYLCMIFVLLFFAGCSAGGPLFTGAAVTPSPAAQAENTPAPLSENSEMSPAPTADAEVESVPAVEPTSAALSEAQGGEEQNSITHSQQLALQSTAELDEGRTESALLLAIEAGRASDTVEAMSAIRAALDVALSGPVILEGHTDSVIQALWNQNESKILTASWDNTARIWDAASGQELVRLDGHTDMIFQAMWNQDESKILTASWDNTARIWDAASGQELVRLDGHTDRIFQAMWNQDESKILTRSWDDTARIWDATSGKELIRLEGHTNNVVQARWSQDESMILTAGDETARVWDTVTGEVLVRIARHTEWVRQAIWSQDESKVLTVAEDTAHVWDATSGNELLRLEGHTNSVLQATWSQDESKILTRSFDGTARIWDAKSGEELVLLAVRTDRRPADTSVTEATWNRDESKILTRSFDGIVRIWDATSGNELVRFDGHMDNVTQATWNQDESKILTASEDTTARIWAAASGEELIRLEDHTGPVVHAMWSQDESKILTASWDNTARIWTISSDDPPAVANEDATIDELIAIACDKTPRNMTLDEWNRFMAGAYRPTCPTALLPDDVIQGIIADSDALVRQGEIPSAIQQLQQLNDWLEESGQDRNLSTSPSQFVASVLVDEAEPLARRGEIEEAVALLTQANEYDPTLEIDPEARARELVASPIAYGETVTGVASAEQPETWRFEGQAGDIVTIDQVATADSDLDPYLVLFGPDGDYLTENDDFGSGFDSKIDGFVLPADGVYLILASGYDDSGPYELTLTLGDTPGSASDQEGTLLGTLQDGVYLAPEGELRIQVPPLMEPNISTEDGYFEDGPSRLLYVRFSDDVCQAFLLMRDQYDLGDLSLGEALDDVLPGIGTEGRTTVEYKYGPVLLQSVTARGQSPCVSTTIVDGDVVEEVSDAQVVIGVFHHQGYLYLLQYGIGDNAMLPVSAGDPVLIERMQAFLDGIEILTE